jgi:hypothetical protein
MASKLSEQIAHDLFMDGGINRKAKRLVLESEGTKYPGSGWGEKPLADRVDMQLVEVREVLSDLLELAERIGEAETFQRARALYERITDR